MNSNMEESFIGRLRIIVNQVGSIAALAKKTGISSRQISFYLAGTNNPSSERLTAMATAAGVSVQWLMTGEEPSEGRREIPTEVKEREPQRLDLDLLETVVEAIEEELAQRGGSLPPRKKAKLIRLVYQYHELDVKEGKQELNRRKVVELIELAA